MAKLIYHHSGRPVHNPSLLQKTQPGPKTHPPHSAAHFDPVQKIGCSYAGASLSCHFTFSPSTNSMEQLKNPLLDVDVPKVTGRKAARSLRLFEGDRHTVDPLADLEGQEDAPQLSADEAVPRDLAAKTSTQLKPPTPKKQHRARKLRLQLAVEESAAGDETPDSSDHSYRPMLEPVSSATYFPHTPVKDDLQSPKAAEDYADTENLQHLMADLEFDRGSHGDITQIKMHKHEEDNAASTSQEATLQRSAATETDSVTEAYPLSVELRPFRNKVGGHTAIFRFSKKAVCKALMNRENIWYEAVERLHLDLLKFMPKYIGVLNVRYLSLVLEELLSPDLAPADSEPQDSIVTHHRRPSLPAYDKRQQRVRMAEDGLPPEVSLDDNRHIIPDLLWKQYSNSAPNSSGFEDFSGSSPKVADTAAETADHEDFSVGSTSVNTDLQAQVIQEVFVPQGRRSDDIFEMDNEEETRNSGNEELADAVNAHEEPATGKATPILRKHTRFERFILLEDLTANMQKPCALDLKMGTRQYGVEANESKQASQRKKCMLTTSRELGVRVCGLQVWNEKKQRYYMRDKYFGRRLRSGMPFAKTLAKFLYDGTTGFSIAVKIPTIVRMLEELFKAFEKLAGYRMYGSSVLLMYDGANSLSKDVSVHIIDFAQSVIGGDTYHYSRPPKYPELPDMGYLRGLRSLMHYFKDIFKIITGVDYNELADPEQYVEANKDRLQNPCDYVGDFAEDNDEEAPPDHSGPDPFDVHYVSNNDESGISD